MANINQAFSFAYTGGSQSFSAEANHLYYLECYGASGGAGGGDGAGSGRDIGGLGGFAKGYYKNASAGTWTVQVGGAGGNGTVGNGGAGGYHGGGKGGHDGDSDDYETGGGGGGCTTIHQLLTAGGGSGGGSPNSSKPGKNVTELHDGKGCGGAGGAGYSSAGGAGGLVNGGTAPTCAHSGESSPGKNYIGGVTSGTHGTSSTRGNGSAKITCKAKTPTISVASKTNTSVTVTVNYNCDMSVSKSVQVQINGGAWTSVHSTSASSFANTNVSYTVPTNTEGTLLFRVNNGYFSKDLSLKYDNKPPVITFPTESYSTTWVKGETRVGFTGTDTNDTSLDYEVQLYLNDVMFHSYSTTSTSVTPPHAFVSSADEGEGTFYIKVRAKQSSDTSNGTTQDIWSGWYTSPSVQFKDNIITYPNFSLIKWYQDVEQQGLNCEYTQGLFETKHYCNGELVETTQHSLGLTPPLLYTPIKPHLWSYEYYAVTRVQVNGKWSGWYTSPTVEVQFNVQPNDVEFSKGLPPYFIQGEVTTVEWKESTDPNATKTTYTASLMNNTTEELFEVRDLEEPRLTFTVPDDIVSNNITFSIVAYSDGLYSNPVSSPKMAITDVKIMDCNLDFPVLNTNVTGQVTEFILEINGDRRISKAENFTDYTIPLHYFRKGENKLTLIAKDRNGVEVTRTWKVNLDFNSTNLIPLDTIEVEGYMSFNYDPEEYYVPCTTLFKNNLDLGVVEHELYGSTPFEGANTITQKLVIKRSANEDSTQLRTLKITGAIE